MLIKRVWDGLEWRIRLAARDYARRRYLRRTFANSQALLESYFAKTPCETAICRDGLVIQHPPGRHALATMLLEVWHDEIYTRNFYRPATGDTIVDAGANIGLFSLWVARHAPSCRVLAFEPFEENFQLLEKNLSAAGAHNVRAIRAALAATNGQASILDGGGRSQDHRLASDSLAGMPIVPTWSFSEVLKEAGGGPIALFKCDIEGSEHDLFANASQHDLSQVSQFAIEYHDNIRPGTLQLLQRLLAATHDVTIRPQGADGYGMLYARGRSRGALR